jgi:hypothetical protein
VSQPFEPSAETFSFGARPAEPATPPPIPQFQPHAGYGPPPIYSAGDYQTGPYPITQLPYEVPPPRRDLKSLWITLSIVLVLALVGGGGFWYYLDRTERRIDQEQATVALPDRVGDLVKSDDAALSSMVAATMEPLNGSSALNHVVGSGYEDPTDTKQKVVIVAASGRIQSPELEMQTMFSELKENSVKDITDYPPGPLGGRVRCGAIEEGGAPFTVCAWADHGSLGLGMFLNRSVEESALLFVRIRQEVVTR